MGAGGRAVRGSGRGAGGRGRGVPGPAPPQHPHPRQEVHLRGLAGQRAGGDR